MCEKETEKNRERDQKQQQLILHVKLKQTTTKIINKTINQFRHIAALFFTRTTTKKQSKSIK